MAGRLTSNCLAIEFTESSPGIKLVRIVRRVGSERALYTSGLSSCVTIWLRIIRHLFVVRVEVSRRVMVPLQRGGTEGEGDNRARQMPRASYGPELDPGMVSPLARTRHWSYSLFPLPLGSPASRGTITGSTHPAGTPGFSLQRFPRPGSCRRNWSQPNDLCNCDPGRRRFDAAWRAEATPFLQRREPLGARLPSCASRRPRPGSGRPPIARRRVASPGPRQRNDRLQP